MSSVLVLQTKNEIYMGSDTAISTSMGANTYRVSENGQKIFQFNNMVVFCSGDLKTSYSIMLDFYNIEQKTVEKLQEISKTQIINNNIMVEILVATIENKIPKLYQISSYNDFNIVELTVNNDELGVWSGGFKTEECKNIATKNCLSKKNVFDIYINTFDELSCEEIGGDLILYRVGTGKISRVLNYQIKEKPIIKRITSNIHNYGLVVAEKIIGDIILGSNLKIMGDNGILEILGNLLTIKDNQDKTRVLMGEYEAGKYGAKFPHEDGSYTTVDKDGMQRYVAGTGKTYFFERELQIVGNYNQKTYSGSEIPATDIEIEQELNPYSTVVLPNSFIGKNFKILAEIYMGDGIYIDRFSSKYMDPPATNSRIYFEIQSIEGQVWDGLTLATMPSSIKNTGKFKIRAWWWYTYQVSGAPFIYKYASSFKVKVDVIV